MYVINVFLPGKGAKSYYLGAHEFSVGSSNNNDLIINDKTVSRKHCILKNNNKTLFIKDLNSKNGIFLNGEQIEESSLNDGDILLLGKVKIEVEEIAEDDGYIFDKGEKIKKIPLYETDETKVIFSRIDKLIFETINSINTENEYKFFDTINEGLLNCSTLVIGNKFKDTYNIIYSKGDFKSLLKNIDKNLEEENHNKVTDNTIFFYYKGYFLMGKEGIGIPFFMFKEIIKTYEKIFFPDSEESFEQVEENIDKESSNKIIYTSNIMSDLVVKAKKLAKTNLNVLITGESGVGKELLANFIHNHSKRKDYPCLAINCAALPETLIESELFGVEKGAATDTKERPGKFELAHNGTLFLDEICSTSPQLQSKLLRAIQFKEFYRVGGTSLKKVDVRIISATNKPIQNQIKKEEFRKDLYFRIAGEEFTIPPLTERPEDILVLVNYFIKKYSKGYKKNILGISNKALDYLLSYDFPGNIRELENEIEKAVVFANNRDIIREKHISKRIKQKESKKKVRLDNEWNLNKIIDDVEQQVLVKAIEKFHSKTKIAKRLGISRTTLDSKLNKYSLSL